MRPWDSCIDFSVIPWSEGKVLVMGKKFRRFCKSARGPLAWILSLILVWQMFPAQGMAYALEEAAEAFTSNDVDAVVVEDTAAEPEVDLVYDEDAAEPEVVIEEEPVVEDEAIPEEETVFEEDAVPEEEPVIEDEAISEEEPAVEEEAVTEEEPEVEAEPEEEPAPATPMLAGAKSLTVDGVTITVGVGDGVLPEGWYFTAEPITGYQLTQVEDAVTEQQADAQVVVAFDITLYDADGNEIQPVDGTAVRVTFRNTGAETDNVSVYHVSDEMVAEYVDTASASANRQSFDADQFSIYVVVESGADARLVVQFMNGTTEVASMMITENQIEQIEEYLYDPGMGELAEGVQFRGWTTNPNYTTETTGMTIEEVREDVTKKLNAGVEDGDTVTYYAMAFKTYTVTYLDEKGVLLKTDQILAPATSTDDQTYTVNLSYTPYPTDEPGVVADFVGWQQISPEVEGTEVLYQNDDTMTLSETTYVLKAKTQKGHWLTFEENLSNATYTEPQFVAIGANPTEPTTAPTRSGYTFDGWYTEDASDARDGQVSGSAFDFNQELTANTTVYGKWTAASTANYNVVVWQQQVDGDGYDYSGTTVTVTGATVGQNTYAVNGTAGGSSARVYTVSGQRYQDVSFRGFHFSRVDATTTVKPDGTTVINVYFDRNEITYNFEGYTYTETTATGGTQYGLVDGEYVELSYSRYYERWYYGYYNWYDDTRYTRTTETQSFSGLYGSAFTQWPDPGNGSVWSIGDISYPLPLTEFKPEAVNETSSSNEFTFELDDMNNNYSLVVYKQTETGAWSYTNAYTITTGRWSGGTWTPSETYTGFTIDAYRKGQGGSWTSCTPSTNIRDAYNLYLRYSRNQYNITYSDGVFVAGADETPVTDAPSARTNFVSKNGVYYEANINTADYNITPELNGYVFLGWYDNALCAGDPYTFDKMPAHNVTLYAKWGLREYAVNLHPNDSTSDPIVYTKEDQAATFYVDEGDKIGNVGGERIYYDLVGWYTDEDMTHVFNFESFRLNATTVGNYGHLYTESEIDPQYPTTVGELNLYAKWRSHLIGAEGIKVEYDATDKGTNAPEDVNYYVDGAKAIAGSAATANDADNYVFSHWAVMKWNGTEYVESDVTVFPGETFDVNAADARITDAYNIVVAPDDLESDGTYTYTIQLKAVYVEKDQEVKTHIYWYDNHGGVVREDTGLSINQAVDVPAAPTRPGYTFKGWVRDVENTSTKTTSSTELFITYTNGAYSASQVAADENWASTDNQYHAMYALWEANTYTVKFDKNADDATGTMADQTFTYDVEQNLTANAYTRPNYKFLGWSTESDATAATYTDQQSVKNLTAEPNGVVTLYAVWELDVATVTVHHYLKGTTTKVADDVTESKTIGTEIDPSTVPAATFFLSPYDSYPMTKDSTNPTTPVTVTADGAEIMLYYTLPLTIEASTVSKTYDGTPLAGEYTVEGTLPGDGGEDGVVRQALGEAPSITNVSESPKEYLTESDQAAITGIPEYYDVSFTPGTLTITARPASFTGVSETKDYTGSEIEITTVTPDGTPPSPPRARTWAPTPAPSPTPRTSRSPTPPATT